MEEGGREGGREGIGGWEEEGEERDKEEKIMRSGMEMIDTLATCS